MDVNVTEDVSCALQSCSESIRMSISMENEALEFSPRILFPKSPVGGSAWS